MGARAWWVVAVVAGTATGACGPPGEPPPDAGLQLRDSAGVVVAIPASRPSWGAGEGWSVGEPRLLGAQGPAPELGFVADLAVDGAGRVFVLDQQARAIQVFGPEGAWRSTLGGPGEGPGEIGPFAGSLAVLGDTLFLADWSLGRLSRFSTDGDFLRSEGLPTPPGARSWWRAGGGALWLRTLRRTTGEDGRWGGEDLLLRYGGEARADTVLHFRYEHTDLGARGAPRAPLLVASPAWTILADGGVAWLLTGEGRLRIHGPDGVLRRVVAAPWWRGRTPSVAELAGMEERLGDRLEMLGGSRDALERLPVDAPELLPPIATVRAGPEGTLWVQRLGSVEDMHPMALNTPDPPARLGGPTWDVLDAGGRYLGTVRTPPGFHPLRFTDDAFYGVIRDDLDVERVARLPLVAGAR